MSVKLTFIFFGGNMSLEEIREANIKKVVKKALEMFTENGIVNTKVNDIAIACNLTERSLFRYFKTKSDLVIASCIMFWRNLYQESFKAYDSLDKNIDIFEKIFQVGFRYFISCKEIERIFAISQNLDIISISTDLEV